MAAARICICGCGREISATARPHKATFDTACRKRVERSRRQVDDLSILEHEPIIVAEVRARTLRPEDAVLWVIFPETMRARCSHVVDREQVAA
jgi:hypothetical protein